MILVGWSLHIDVGMTDLRIASLDRGLLAAAGLGLALLVASPRSRDIARLCVGSPVGVLVLLTGLAFVMSLGPQIFARGRLVEEKNLYALFYDFVPGFDGLRVPARFGMIVALGLAALAGCGAAPIARRRYGTVALTVAALAIVAEAWAVPIPVNVNSTDYRQRGLVALPDTLPTAADLPAVYNFVKTLPPASALIELPFGEVAFETRYMYYSTFHWRRLVNGYSGGGPDEYGLSVDRFKEILSEPDVAWQSVLDSRATHVIVHEGSYADDRGRLISAWAAARGAQEVGAFGGDRIFAITP
jgi:hypothetical protein